MNVAALDLPFIDFRPAATSVGQRVRCALETLLVLGLFTGALFLGWGWDEVLQLFSHPARATLLVALMLQLAVSVAQARPLTRSRDRVMNPFAGALLWLLAAAGLSMVASSAFWDRRILLVLPGEDVTRYIGLGLFLAGLATNAWQRRSVRAAWDGEVQSAGPRWNRKYLLQRLGGSLHPGLVMAVVGLPMVFLSKVGLAGSACFAACAIVRGIWNVRTLCHNTRIAEQRLEAA